MPNQNTHFRTCPAWSPNVRRRPRCGQGHKRDWTRSWKRQVAFHPIQRFGEFLDLYPNGPEGATCELPFLPEFRQDAANIVPRDEPAGNIELPNVSEASAVDLANRGDNDASLRATVRERARLSQELQCAKNCRGGLMWALILFFSVFCRSKLTVVFFYSGQHKCFRHGRSLIISCLGSGNCASTFKTRNDFNRHCRSVHFHTQAGIKKLFDCPVPGCDRVGGYGFKRKDNILQHRRLVHGEDIPKVRFRFGGGVA